MISLAFIGVGLGIGLVVLGAGLGIGRIGDSAAQGISRQPEASGAIQLAMIISAALIEGVALFGLVIAFQMGGQLNKETLSEFAKSAPAVEQAK
jgi:F-type H+-transporting ATPase subunit c